MPAWCNALTWLQTRGAGESRLLLAQLLRLWPLLRGQRRSAGELLHHRRLRLERLLQHATRAAGRRGGRRGRLGGRTGQAQRRRERERGCTRNDRSLGPRGRVPSRRLPPSHALRPGLALLLERVLQLRVLPLHVGEHLLHMRRIAAGLLRVRMRRVLRLRLRILRRIL